MDGSVQKYNYYKSFRELKISTALHTVIQHCRITTITHPSPTINLITEPISNGTKRPPIGLQQNSFSEHFGYNNQLAAAVDTPYSQSVLAGAALSPTDSNVSEANSEFSDIYTTNLLSLFF